MLPPAEPGPEHRQAVRPRGRARADGPRAHIPAGTRRSLPRPPAQAEGRRPRRACHPAACRDPRAGLHRQHEPAPPLHHPGPRRSRPPAPITPPRGPAPAHPPRQSQRRPAGPAGETGRRVPGDDQPRRAHPVLRLPAHPAPANQSRLADWIQNARACDLPYVQSFARGLDLDKQAAIAAVTLPFHNGRTEGVNTRTKMIKRQMYGRAGFTLLRHRILLALRHASSPPKVSQSRSSDRPASGGARRSRIPGRCQAAEARVRR